MVGIEDGALVIPTKPLDNFPVIRTRDIEELRAALAKIYAKPTLEFSSPTKALDASINQCRLQHVRLGYGAFGTAMRFEFPASNCFLQLCPVRGKGEIVSRNISVSLAAGASVTISPDEGFKGNYDADYECLVLKIDTQALTKKLAAMTGAIINEPLRLQPRVDLTRPEAQLLHQYLPLLADTLNAANPPFPDWWISQTEQLLMAMFLCGHRHNYSHLLEQEAPDIAPWQVRRAEDYIEANWQRPITLEDLVQVTGVNAFSLFDSFKKSRGYSPLEFISLVRSKRRSAN
jgi:hypothetical protein